jgi:hypothetical protein
MSIVKRRDRWLLAVAGASLVVVTGVLLAAGAQGTAVATVLGFAVSIVALGISALGTPWRRSLPDHATLAAAARGLARQVGTREAREQQRVLADSGVSKPADLQYAQVAEVTSRTDGGHPQGWLSGILGFYERLNRGRLLILGEAGAGKTVLANQLLIDLIEHLPAQDPLPGAVLAVPVRLSISAFDPGPGCEYAPPGEVSVALDAWIASQLTDVYQLSPAISASLVGGGWILPILDGLDEIDPAGDGDVRARAVLRALNQPVGTAPRAVVLTCRTSKYRQLITGDAPPGREPVLQDASAIEIRPLKPAEVGAHLTRRFPDPTRPGHVQRRWQPVLDDLAGPLGEVLSSPLALFMCATAYAVASADPADLTRIPADRLRRHLLGALIPAVLGQRPGPRDAAYRAGEVTHWLTTLARHLRRQEQSPGGSGSDVDLYLLWTAAGPRRPRYLAAAAHGILAALPLLVLADWYVHATTHLLAPRGSAVVIGAAGAALVAGVCWRASRREVAPGWLELSQLRAHAGRRRVGGGIVAGLAGAAAICYTSSFWYGFVLGMAGVRYSEPAIWLVGWLVGVPSVLLASALAWWLAAWLARGPGAISRPGALVAQGLSRDLAILLVFGLLGGIVMGVTYWIVIPGGLAAGLIGGFIIGLAVGLFRLADSPWVRYLVATAILARRHQFPARPAHFLDWAYGAGLLRMSGISAQFRHRELQDFLASGSSSRVASVSREGGP